MWDFFILGIWEWAIALKFFVGFLSKGLLSKKPPVSE